MSFVEGFAAIGAGAADSAFVACIGGLVIVSLLAGVPALATALRLLRADRGLGKFLWRLIHRDRAR